ncbi:MAG: hypothetical protein QOK43_3215 [Acidimicrobiaceae bacterium]|nr:hypothetical protein [Acidimicrobiaceae bacterium]
MAFKRAASKIGLPLLGLLIAIGLSTVVAATYLSITRDTGVGSFTPSALPAEEAVTTTTAPTPVTGPDVPTTTTSALAVPGPASGAATSSAPSPAPLRSTPRPTGASSPTTAARATTTTTEDRPPPSTTTTTRCDNSGKGNCRGRGSGGDDD